jgi:hypothetical protein
LQINVKGSEPGRAAMKQAVKGLRKRIAEFITELKDQ